MNPNRFRVKGNHYSRTLTEVNRDEGLLRGFAKNAASPSSSVHRPRKCPSLESLGRRIDPLAERGIDPFSEGLRVEG